MPLQSTLIARHTGITFTMRERGGTGNEMMFVWATWTARRRYLDCEGLRFIARNRLRSTTQAVKRRASSCIDTVNCVGRLARADPSMIHRRTFRVSIRVPQKGQLSLIALIN